MKEFNAAVPPSRLGLAIPDALGKVNILCHIGMDGQLWAWIGTGMRRTQTVVAYSGRQAIEFVTEFAVVPNEAERERLLLILGVDQLPVKYVSQEEKREQAISEQVDSRMPKRRPKVVLPTEPVQPVVPVTDQQREEVSHEQEKI